ncbi:MAG: bifunctional 4-hydroxy-2-oxoglutarate aldolase/2-dehydro-3-deoxy-phosphogluconate aldolase, partial [Microcoleaceae cyanobacterium]
IKSLQGPLGQIPLIPTGGVTLANSQQFLKAGAIAVGLASDLFPTALVKTENWQSITAIAQKLQKELKSSYI